MPEINSVAGQLVGIPVGQVYTAGKGIKIDNVNKVVSVDETVLWDGEGTPASSCALSENPANFERVRIYAGESASYVTIMEFPASSTYIRFVSSAGGTNVWLGFYFMTMTSTTLAITDDKRLNFGSTSSTAASFTVSIGNKTCLRKVVGINRIASN